MRLAPLGSSSAPVAADRWRAILSANSSSSVSRPNTTTVAPSSPTRDITRSRWRRPLAAARAPCEHDERHLHPHLRCLTERGELPGIELATNRAPACPAQRGRHGAMKLRHRMYSENIRRTWRLRPSRIVISTSRARAVLDRPDHRGRRRSVVELDPGLERRDRARGCRRPRRRRSLAPSSVDAAAGETARHRS